jgi:hypothetical protein
MEQTGSQAAVPPDPGLSSVASQSRRFLGQILTAAATPVHYASLVVALPLLVHLDRDQWFAADVFLFFQHMQPGQPLDLFASHNGHWTTIPFLIALPIFKVFGLRSMTPYNALNVVLHLLVTHLLWRWMRRLGADPWAATALAGVFLFVGGGSEALSSWFQMTTALPIALGLGGAMLVDHAGAGIRRDLLYWPIGVAAVMCSVAGVAMVVLAVLVALLRRGWLAAIRVASLPAVVYLLWLALYGRDNFIQQPGQTWQLALVPQDIWTGITYDVDATTGLIGGGAVILIALGCWLFVRRRLARTEAAFAFAAVAAGLSFFLALGLDRTTVGPQGFTYGRYGYVFIAMLIPAVALALIPVSRHVAGRVLVVALSALFVVNGLGQLETLLHAVDPVNVADRDQILAAAHLLASGAPLAVSDDALPEPINDGDLPLGLLRSLLQTGALPMDSPLSTTDYLNAVLRIQLSVTAQPLPGLGAGTPALAPNSVQLVTPASGPNPSCVTVASPTATSQLQFVFSGPGYIEIVPDSDGQISVQLSWAQTPGTLTAGTATFPVTALQPAYLNVTATGVAPLVTLPAGVDLVCGAST